jgi:hypothetical protein
MNFEFGCLHFAQQGRVTLINPLCVAATHQEIESSSKSELSLIVLVVFLRAKME